MKLHLNLSLRRALLAAMAAVSTISGISHAGVVDSRYDLQYYLDFIYNKGIFAAGNTGINVLFKDGTGVSNPVIPLMPNMDSVATGYIHNVVIPGIYESYDRKGGANLFTAQYVSSAAHCGEVNIHFLREGNSLSTKYTSSGYTRCSLWETEADATYDWGVQRLNKLVTEVAYTPYATDEFIENLKAGDWLYRAGEGKAVSTDKTFSKNQEATGGLVDISEISRYNDEGRTCVIRTFLTDTDVAPPLEIGALKGDSGSPFFAWDDANDRFVQVAFASQSWETEGFGNDIYLKSNPTQLQNFIDSMTIEASGFNGEETIIWGAQDAATGKGTLSQGSTTVEYTGKGTGNGIKDTLALAFSTTDTQNEQVLEMQGSVDMGAGALIFENGKWKLTETAADHTLSSAGFEIKDGAELTWALTGTSSEEIRKVGEGILNITGSGDNEAKLVVGGGTTVYNVTRDEDGNITGCTLGNKGETRLNRTGGYAASSVRLEGGVAIIVLMGDNQFKTNETGGDTFSFGNDGGLLNLNGHDLSWGVINQEGSGTGARIGNFTPQGESTPRTATFTYTGSGTFAGGFMDEGAGEGKALLAVQYDSAGNTWKLTGNSTNAGGFTVQAGTMVLEGTNTPHVQNTDANDWTFASMETSGVKVESGAKFQLSHHAQLRGNIEVAAGGVFELNQTANTASESISGGLRQDMESLGIASLIGDVSLTGNASMIVNTDSPVTTIIQGSITGDATSTITKTGAGTLKVTGGSAGFAGTISVQEGTLAAGSNLLSSASAITFTGGTLDLSDTTFTTGGTGISLNGALSVSNALIELGDSVQNTGTYVIFDFSAEGASLDSWNESQLRVNGVSLQRYAGASLAKTDNTASITFTSLDMNNFSDLQWSGGATGTWDRVAANWDRTSDGADTRYTFVNGDGVSFSSSADVTLAEDISAAIVTIARPEGAAEGETVRVSLDEAVGKLTATAIEVNQGTTLAFTSEKAGYTTANISGNGTVELCLTNADNSLNLGANFTGETYVKSGKLGTANVQAGATLRLADGVNLVAQGGDFTANLVVEGNTAISGGATPKFMGTVTGDGTLSHSSNGYYEFHGNVNLGALKHTDTNQWGREMFFEDATIGTVDLTGGQLGFQKDSNITTLKLGASTNFVGFGWKGEGDDWESADNVISTGTHNIGTATIAGGKVYFNGATTISTATISGGTTTFTNSADITELTISGGTVRFTTDSVGTTGRDINLAGGTLQLHCNGAQTVLSRLNVSESSTIVNGITAAENVLERSLSDVSIAADKTLKLLTVPGNLAAADSKGAVKWRISNLSGAGTLEWASFSYHDSKSSHLVLSGDGCQFTGEVFLNRTFDQTNGNYQTYLELASAKAVQNGSVRLQGNKATGQAALAINTQNAQIGGLTGNEFTHLYAGAAVEAKSTTTPGSTAANTLTISGSGGTFAGTVGTAADTARLNLAMTGSGTQTFSGHAYLGDVSVSAGKLSLTQADVNGAITVSGGVLEATSASFSSEASSVEITGGTLALGSNATALLSAGGGVTMSSGILDLSGITFATEGGIALGGTMSISGGVINLGGNLQANTTYQIFDLTAGGQLDGWVNLTTANISLGGTNMSNMGRAEITLGADGSFLYNASDSWDLTWNGGSTGIWNQNRENTPWQTGDSTAAAFVNNDNAIFTSSATATLGSDIEVSRLDVQAGTVVIKDSGSYEFRAGTANVAAMAHLQIWNETAAAGANNVLTELILGAGATLSTNNRDAVTAATRIDTLQMDGTTATLKDDNHSGYLSVGTLNMKDGVTDAVLSLKKASASQNCTVFEFGANSSTAGNFAGTIELKSTAISEWGRPALILLSGENAAKSAVISLTSNASAHENAIIGLGINNSNVRIAGLDSSTELGNKAVLFSGSIAANVAWATGNIDGSTGNTLTIDTAASKTHTFRGTVVNSLNLVKDGEGAQAFSGIGTFGTVTVNKGTLTLGGTTTASGAMTINAGKVVLNQTSGTTYTLAGNVTGAGTLEVADGTTLAVNNQTISANLELAAGAALTYNTGAQGANGVNVRGQNMLQGNITINKDATFSFTGNAYDSLSNSATGKSITVDGGTLDFGSTRHGMGSWQLNLSNGAKVTGDGGSYDVNGTRYAALDINQSGQNTINATSGDNTISAKTRLRGGSTINYNVAENASLNVSGLVHADGRKTQTTPASGGGIVKQGAGVLHLNNSDDELDSISVTGGTANIHGAADYTLAQLHAATRVEVGFYAGTTLDTTTQSCVSVSGSALLGGGATLNTSLTLNEGATLDMTDLGNGAVTLNGALTFNGKITMGEHLLNIVNEMSGWQELELFTGLSGGVNLPSVTEAAVVNGDVLASEVFSNVNNTDVYVRYHVAGNVGSLMVVYIPEPTTSTLSLLALSALAARRRRKA